MHLCFAERRLWDDDEAIVTLQPLLCFFLASPATEMQSVHDAGMWLGETDLPLLLSPVQMSLSEVLARTHKQWDISLFSAFLHSTRIDEHSTFLKKVLWECFHLKKI